MGHLDFRYRHIYNEKNEKLLIRHTKNWSNYSWDKGGVIDGIMDGIMDTIYRNNARFSNGIFYERYFSGIVEPIGALITILLTNMVVPILPYLLSFAAGAMLYVVVEELIPESQEGEHSNIGTIGVAIGFALMMLLDVALG